MKAKPTPGKAPQKTEQAAQGAAEKETLEARALAAEAMANPLRYFTGDQTRKILGIGEKAMTLLAGMNPPSFAGKYNPHHLSRWMEANADKLGDKIA